MHERLVRLFLRWSLDHSTTVFLIVGALSVASAFAATELRVEAGHSKLTGQDNVHTRRFNAFMREFGSPNSLVALVKGGDEAHRREVTARLTEELPSTVRSAPGTLCRPEDPPRAPGCVRSVMARIDVAPFADHALLYMAPEDVADVAKTLQDESLGAGLLVETRGLISLFGALAEGMEAHAEDEVPEGRDGERTRDAMKGIARAIDELGRRLEAPPSATDPTLLEALLEQAEEPVGQLGGMDRLGYLSSDDGEIKLATIRMAHETDDPRTVIPFVDYVRSHADRIAAEVNASCEACAARPLTVSLTGYPALIADESVGVQRDIVRTTIVAVLGVILFFLIGFRSLRFALLGLVPLVPAVLWTLAFVRYTFDYLSILTSSFVAVMIGLGVDFAVYLLVRFQEARRLGQDPREAAETAVLKAGPAILTGGLTTAGAFFALSTSSYKGFAELGIMGGVGVLTPLFTTLVVLPALLSHPRLNWFQRKVAPTGGGSSWRFPLPEWIVRIPALFVIIGLLVAGSMAWQGRSINWSFDYASMLDDELPSIAAWKELTENTGHSTEVVAIVARSLDETADLCERLEAKESVARVAAITDYLPERQQEKLASLAALAPIVGTTTTPTRAPDPISQGALVEALEELVDTLVDTHFEAVRADAEQASYLEPLIVSMKAFKKRVEGLDGPVATERLGALQRDVLALQDRTLNALRKASGGTLLDAATLLELLPEGIRTRMANGDRYAVYAYPSAPLRDEAVMRTFVEEVQGVSQEATGFPISHFLNIATLKVSFRHAGIVTLFAVLFLLLVDFRSLRRTFLAMVPLTMGLSIAWGGMALLGMAYHPANVIAFPLIIGIGIDAGVHILHRHQEEGAANLAAVVRHTGRAVLMSTGTTMIGFGSLSIARHNGMSEMGLVLLMGIAASLFGATIILPAILGLRKGEATQDATLGT